jgi:hypothetical protein
MAMELSEKDLARLQGLGFRQGPPPRRGGAARQRGWKTRRVSRGVDPAFGCNPGKAGVEIHAARAMGRGIQDMNPQLAARLASPDFVALESNPGVWDMIDAFRGRREPNEPEVVVGALSQAVLEHHRGLTGEDPDNGAIVLTKDCLARMLRDTKTGAGRGMGLPTRSNQGLKKGRGAWRGSPAWRIEG